MIRQYCLRPLCVLLWISIFFISSLFFIHKASAQQCGFAQHPLPAVPDPDYCTGYFSDSSERLSVPPCNSDSSCSNKVYSVVGIRCKVSGATGDAGLVDGTACCKNLPGGWDFCDQRYRPEIYLPYDFRCCKIPPTPTPFPTPVVVGCLKDGITTLDCIPENLQRIVNWLLVFAGVVALIFIIHSGLKFVLSSGDPKKVDEARNTFSYAIMGLIIVLFAFLIINIISFVSRVNCIKFFGFVCL